MPVLVPLMIPFFAFAAAIVLVGLSQTHTAAHGSTGIKGFIEGMIHNSLIVQLFGLAKKATAYAISHFAAAQLRHLSRWLVSMGTLTGGWFAALAAFSEDITNALLRVEHAIPGEIQRIVSPVRRLARLAEHAAQRAEARAKSVAHTLHRFEARVNGRLHAVEHTIAVTLPREIGGIRSRERVLEHDIGSLRDSVRGIEDGAIDTWRWLNAHRTSAAMGLFTGAVAWALTRLGYGFLRCRSWQRLGKSLTCNDANILSDLLAAATLVVGAMSLVELAREEQKVVGEAAKIVRGFWEL